MTWLAVSRPYRLVEKENQEYDEQERQARKESCSVQATAGLEATNGPATPPTTSLPDEHSSHHLFSFHIQEEEKTKDLCLKPS